MFDVGFQELTLIGVIALIVVGPERLPKMARTLGLWMGKIRYYVGQVKSDIEREVRAQELKEMLDKPARELDDLYKVAEETKGTLDQAKGALGEVKNAFDSEPASISTPNEPAAGSIFPTELPGAEAGAAQIGPAPEEPSETPSTATVPAEKGPVETSPAEKGPVETSPVEKGPVETSPVEKGPVEKGPVETSPVETSPEGTSLPDTGEMQSGERAASAAATDAGENNERSSGRI